MAHSDLVVDDPLSRSFSRIEPGDATLLGVPLFPGRILNDFCPTGVAISPEQWTDCLVGRRTR